MIVFSSCVAESFGWQATIQQTVKKRRHRKMCVISWDFKRLKIVNKYQQPSRKAVLLHKLRLQ